jgi:ATPase subunit of ABC transporter with duplicated ATPase domains
MQTNTVQVLAAENLTRSYDGELALRGFSFSLQAGWVLGFLCPNGTGKMSAIHCHRTQLGESPILDAPEARQRLFLGVEHFCLADSRPAPDGKISYTEHG